MNFWSRAALHVRLAIVGATILAVGVMASLCVFVTAHDDATAGMDVEIIDGKVYTLSPDESKRYEDQLERFGGRMAVLTDRFNRWWASLWRGTRLGYTVLCLSVALGLSLIGVSRLIATHPDYAERLATRHEPRESP